METVSPTKKSLAEALELSIEVLKNLELNELPLENIALKVGRLARLLNDNDMQAIMEYEVSGYPVIPNGLPPEIYRLAVLAGRKFQKEEEEDFPSGLSSTKKMVIKEYVFSESISELEARLKINDSLLQTGANYFEKATLTSRMLENTRSLSSRRSLFFHYALQKSHELKFSGIADDIFTRIRHRVDSSIGKTLANSVKKFNAIYENLRSDNSEDWSNAVHSCRRILQDLADVLFPSQSKPRMKNGKTIQLGTENYVNRIIAFAEDNSESGRFNDLVGSHIKFLGERLDSVFEAAQKGSHHEIVKQEEADRYVAYTYLLVGDLLSLWENKNPT